MALLPCSFPIHRNVSLRRIALHPGFIVKIDIHLILDSCTSHKLIEEWRATEKTNGLTFISGTLADDGFLA
jgi:hypothetical protein